MFSVCLMNVFVLLMFMSFLVLVFMIFSWNVFLRSMISLILLRLFVLRFCMNDVLWDSVFMLRLNLLVMMLWMVILDVFMVSFFWVGVNVFVYCVYCCS